MAAERARLASVADTTANFSKPDFEIQMSNSQPYKKWMCVVCGWIYDEELGDPDSGLPPGMRWDEVPESWVCPDCGAGKEDFEMVEF